MRDKAIDKREYILKLQELHDGKISFVDELPDDASLTITKSKDSYLVKASYKTYDVNFKNFGMEKAKGKNNWEVKVISANHAVNLSDILIREISRAKNLMKIGDFVNLEVFAARWATKKISKLPDAAFAVLRMLPHHTASVKNPNENNTIDKDNLRNALARVNQEGTDLTPEQRKIARNHLERHARTLKIGKFKSSIEERVKKVAVKVLERWENGE